MTGKPSSFQMDRTITMSLVFTLLVQTSGGLIWAGSAAARLDALENRLAVNRSGPLGRYCAARRL